MITHFGILALISTALPLDTMKSGGALFPEVIPKAVPQVPEIPVEKRNLIEVGMNHSLHFESKQVTEQQLILQIRERVRQNRDMKIHVQIHPWNKEGAGQIIDLCQKCGAWNISFATAKG